MNKRQKWAMKKLIILFLALLFFSSGCTYKLYVTSKDYFKGTTAQIQSELGNLGYSIIGEKSETKNEVSVKGTSYTQSGGFGSAMRNNYWTYGEYSFIDSANNEVTYSLKYKEATNYVQNVEVIGCSAKKNYDEICGQNGVVKSNINNMNDTPDTYINVTDTSGTVGVAVGVSTVIVAILLLVILI